MPLTDNRKADGKTTSKAELTGLLGKLLSKATGKKLQHQANILHPGFTDLCEDIVKKLSSVQNYAHKTCQTVISGILPENLAYQKPGTMAHSR